MKSNKISVVVVDPNDLNYHVEINIPDTVKVKSKAKMTITSIDKKLVLKIKPNEFLKVNSTTSKMSTSVKDNKLCIFYSQTFEIEFIKSGELIISNDLFDNIPKGVDILKKRVIIHELQYLTKI